MIDVVWFLDDVFFQGLDGKIVGWRHLIMKDVVYQDLSTRIPTRRSGCCWFGPSKLCIWARFLPGQPCRIFFPPWISAAIRAVFHCKKWLSHWDQWFLEFGFPSQNLIRLVELNPSVFSQRSRKFQGSKQKERKSEHNTVLEYQCSVWMLPGVSWKISLPISLQFILWDNASCHHPEEEILRAVAPASASTTAKKILEKKPLRNVALVVIPGWKSGDSYGTFKKKKLAIWGWFYYGKPSGLAAWSQNANGTGSW